MTTYADLTPYEYAQDARPGMVNVGWLGTKIEWPRGDVPLSAVRKLIASLAATTHAMMRGLHHCEFCDLESLVRIDSSLAYEGFVMLGNGELRVPDPDGTTIYCAPSLIVHYILDHMYRPPDPFLAAVEALPPPEPGGTIPTFPDLPEEIAEASRRETIARVTAARQQKWAGRRPPAANAASGGADDAHGS